MIDSASLPTFERILRRTGDDVGRNGRTRCPLHGGNNRTAFSFDESTGLFNCFSCGEKGDKVSFVQKRLRVDFREALHWLDGSKSSTFPSRPRNLEAVRLAMVLQKTRAEETEGLVREYRDLSITRHIAELALSQFDSVVAWDVLKLVTERRRWLSAALNVLDFGPAQFVIPFLIGSPHEKSNTINSVIDAGGLYDKQQRWIECYE